MTVQEIIDEFEKGCSNTVHSGKPEDCPTCVRAFVRALQAQVDRDKAATSALGIFCLGRTWYGVC